MFSALRSIHTGNELSFPVTLNNKLHYKTDYTKALIAPSLDCFALADA